MPGKIDYQSDVDFFQIVPANSGELVIRVSNLASGMDPRMRIFASDTTTVLGDVNLTNSPSENGYLYIPIRIVILRMKASMKSVRG